MAVTAVLAVLSAAAFAEGVSPKQESVLLRDQITLGDVFDGVTAHADHVLAPAPSFGKSTVLTARDLKRISDAFNLGWVGSGEERVVIRRSTAEIGTKEITAALEHELSNRLKGQRFELEFSTPASIRIPEGGEKSVDVKSFQLHPLTQSFAADLSFPRGITREVKGRYHLLTSVPVLRDLFRPGDIIGAADIEYLDMRASDISANMIVDTNKLIGMTPRRGVPAMRPLNSADLQLPKLVKKGDMVTMILKTKSLSLTTQGRALADGAIGDRLHIVNLSSKKTVEATVTGPQTVTIKPASSQLSLNVQ